MRRFHLFLLILIIAVILLYWSLREATHIRIEAVGSKFSAYINDKKMPEYENPFFERGMVGLYIRNELFPQAWDHFIVRDFHTKEILFSDSFGWEVDKGWQFWRIPWYRTFTGEFSVKIDLEKNLGDNSRAIVGNPEWRDYIIEADCMHCLDAGILLRMKDGTTGLFYNFRPKHEDGFWMVYQNEHRGPPEKSDRYKTTLGFNLRNILSKLLITFFYAVGLLVAIFLFYSIISIILSIPPIFKATNLAYSFITDALVDMRNMNWLKVIAGISIFSVSLVITVYTAVDILEKIPHVQDSISTLFQAKIYKNGRLYWPSPEPREPFDMEMIVNNGKWFSKYLPGHPLAMLAGVIYDLPWLVGPVLGSLSVIFIYLLGREIFSEKIGFLAALLALSSPFFIFMSGSHMAHTSCLFFASMGYFLFAKTYQSSRLPFSIFTGISFGFLFINRPWTAIAVAIPICLIALVDIFRNGPKKLYLYLFAILAFIPFIVFILINNYVLSGNFTTFPYNVYSDSDRLGFGKGWFGGHDYIGGFRNTWLNLMELMHHLFGWIPYFTLAFMYIPFIFLSKDKWDYALAGSFFFLVSAYFFWWYHGICYGPRFWYEAMPAYVLLTIRGVEVASIKIDSLWNEWGKYLRQRWYCPWFNSLFISRPRLAFIVALIPVILLVYSNLTDYLPYKIRTEYRGYNFTNAGLLKKAEQMKIHNAVIFVKKGLFWSVHGSVFHTNSPTLDTDIIWLKDVDPQTNKRAMALFPGRKFYFCDGNTIRPLEY